ncbi:hypothetical protein QYE76_057123 [Lolium multiflorum]|uniref:CCHC-type domain-containing protein n=1 Tax=Lolium multiflorum TaxID=4521 RepID=A0AAD8WNI1_LOLMU|nr:hypothetical protein QYE76_057123 [Lolium multiflorum]
MENYSLLMGAAAVMKMAVEMAAVSMEKPSGALPRSGRVPEQRLLSPRSWLRDGGGSGRFHVGAGIPGVAPHYILPPSTFNVLLGSYCTCISTNHVEEIKELEAQVLSLKKDLEKRHEGKSALDKMLSVQQSPNDKSGLGFNSNNKNKSKSKSNKKKGQDKVKDPAKLVCFKCKVEGHHVRSCPLKKKKHLSEKQQGKRPQGQGQAHARPQVEDRPLPKKNQDIVPQEKKSIKKRKGNTCYLCREKGHFASSCLGSTLSNPIIVDDDYSLGKDKDGNVFAK